jgi:hypothetical protein
MVPVHGEVFVRSMRGWGFRAIGVMAVPCGCEYEKGIWWMPWRQEAMKDVARCENLGGAASGL